MEKRGPGSNDIVYTVKRIVEMKINLAGYIRGLFDESREEGKNVEQRMHRNLCALQSRYTKENLLKIEEIEESKTFLPLTNVKCRAVEAILSKSYFSGDSHPFSISATPG